MNATAAFQQTIAAIDARIADLQKARDLLRTLSLASPSTEVPEPRKSPSRSRSRQPSKPPKSPEASASADPAPGVDTDSVERTDDLTPMSEGAIRIGRSLGHPFIVTDLRARLDGGDRQAYNWIAGWKRVGWIETVSFGSYRRTESFGGSR